MAGHRTGCVRVLFGALGLGAVPMAGVLPQLLTRTVWTCWPLPRQLDQKSLSHLAFSWLIEIDDVVGVGINA